jgi:predicted kinase
MPVWSSQQERALSAVAVWLKEPRPQLFRLFGYAGTGKSTLARHIAECVDGAVVFGAFTGKAALVTRNRASTILNRRAAACARRLMVKIRREANTLVHSGAARGAIASTR